MDFGGGNGAVRRRADVQAWLEASGSIAYAVDRAQECVARAVERLSGLRPSPAQESLTQLTEFVRGSQIKAEITDAGAVATMGKLADGKLGGLAAKQFSFNEALKDGTKLVGMAVITIHKGHLVVLSVHRRATDTEGARAALLAAAGSFTFKQQ